MQTLHALRRLVRPAAVWLATALLTACGPTTAPATSGVPADAGGGVLYVTALSMTPEARVGQVATLHIELTATRDITGVTAELLLAPQILLVQGAREWKLDLLGGRPQAHEVSVCATAPGDWRLAVSAIARPGGGGPYAVNEVYFLRTSWDAASLIDRNHYASSNNGSSVVTVMPGTPGTPLATATIDASACAAQP